MKVSSTEIPDVLIVEPRVHRDDRGFFVETFNERRYREAGIDHVFVQDNHSASRHATLRGLHGQLQRPQGKLVRTVEGEIFDVVVDIRRDSPAFGKWIAATLSATNFLQIYVPPGVLHGFCVVSATAQVEYKCTGFYDPDDEIGVIWNDADLAIEWPIKSPILSGKDESLPTFEELTTRSEA